MFQDTPRSSLGAGPIWATPPRPTQLLFNVSEQRVRCSCEIDRDLIRTKQSVRNEVSDVLRRSDIPGNILGCARNPATNYLVDYRPRPQLASQGINEFGNSYGA
jgi:hypothetical protein